MSVGIPGGDVCLVEVQRGFRQLGWQLVRSAEFLEQVDAFLSAGPHLTAQGFLFAVGQAALDQAIVIVAVGLEQTLGGIYVHDVMSSPVATIPARASLEEAAYHYFMTAGFPAFGVEEQGTIIGMLRHGQLQQVDQTLWPVTTVAEVMTPLEPETMTIAADERFLKINTGLVGRAREQIASII